MKGIIDSLVIPFSYYEKQEKDLHFLFLPIFLSKRLLYNYDISIIFNIILIVHDKNYHF